MKSRSIAKNGIFIAFSIMLLIASVFLLIKYPDAKGMLQTLPFILIGIGSGILGTNIGIVVQQHIFKKNPNAHKKFKIEENDERNIQLNQYSKAKAYDATIYLYSALMLYFALIGAKLILLLPLVGCYLISIVIRMYHLYQCQKKM
ncbi:hypothetical protein [Lachnoclostridium phytofermentans]|uniref:DUF2178 domain-containing protein n=1 Tax=Lachnoclostridium phytofermentans (strain ATCC 700394 / DSM 18823 / ISDg) TaxID=357809 RepID=A9KLP2_LACP7|nr:hypothetical protein [Lachnoclostridium phytofermentans]ABX42786.1 conserved hypothetical protein [Lachnoclostridium phytofermentans ISDg]